MSRTAENSLWYKQKRPVVDKYLSTAKQVEDAVAGRGFLSRPGYLGGMVTAVERDLKFSLSDINHQITADAITRELAQTGHDYDIAYKEAVIAWELDKVILMTDLEKEFVDNKHLRAMDNFEKDQLEITTHLRRFIIMAAKTAIDLEMEDLRQELTRVDQSTFSAEDSLLDAKLRIAERKLDIIPYIEVVLNKQQLIIDAETNNADLKGALMDRKDDLASERLELITANERLNDKMMELIAAKYLVVAAKEVLITAKESLAAAKMVNIPLMEQYIDSLGELNDVKQEIAAAKLANLPYMQAYIDMLGNLNIAKETLANAKLANIPYMDAYMDALEELSSVKREVADVELANIPHMEAHMAKLVDLVAAKEDLVMTKLANIPHMEQYMAATEELISANEEVLGARENILPKLNEKAAAQIAYVAELRAWIVVKQIIAGVKESSAGLMEGRAGIKGNIADARMDLNDSKLDLQEAKLNLEMARMTGRSDLMTQKITNAAPMLTEREKAFDATIERDGELLDAQINFDLYEEEQRFESMKEINDHVIPLERELVSRTGAARILQQRRLGEIQSTAKLTSELVHLLS